MTSQDLIKLLRKTSSSSTGLIKLKWEKRLFEKKVRREKQSWEISEDVVWTPPASRSSCQYASCVETVNLATLHYISQNPLHCMFSVRVEHKDILHGFWKVEVKAATLFLCLKGSGRGTKCCCPTGSMRSPLVFVGQQLVLRLFRFPP